MGLIETRVLGSISLHAEIAFQAEIYGLFFQAEISGLIFFRPESQAEI